MFGVLGFRGCGVLGFRGLGVRAWGAPRVLRGMLLAFEKPSTRSFPLYEK